MDKRSYLFIFLLNMLFVFHSIGNLMLANTYYVDCNHPSANNSNPGSLTLPWLTIQHASETIVAGDTVFIRSGIYNEQVLTEQSGNTSAGYIVFAAYPNETPVIDGTGVVSGTTGFIIAHGYIKLIGLEIRNWEQGIWMEYAEFIELSHCEVHECEFGIGVSYGTHDFTMNNVIVHHFDLYGFDATADGGLDCYNGTFNDCVSHTGRDPLQNVDGFALSHGTQNGFVFNRCTTYDVFDGFDIGSNHVTLNNCSAYNCWNGGYKLWQRKIKLINCLGYNNAIANVELDWSTFGPGGVTLMNCTFYNSQDFNVWVENTGDTLHMYNCILAGGDNIGLAFEQLGVSNYHGDYNLFHNDNPDRAIAVAYTDEFSLQQIQNGEWTTYSGQDGNSIVAFTDTEIFVNPGGYDLHLLQSSPAVDNGTGVGAPSNDYDDNPRPSGQGYDIGAYEYQFSTDIGDNNLNSNPEEFILYQNYPNPFNPKTRIPYAIPQRSWVTMKIYDSVGRELQILVDKEQNRGFYTVQFDASASEGLASGIYLYRLETENFSSSRKLILLK